MFCSITFVKEQKEKLILLTDLENRVLTFSSHLTKKKKKMKVRLLFFRKGVNSLKETLLAFFEK